MSELPTRQKVYADGPDGVRVPFSEVRLTGGEPSVRLYDTSGPGSEPAVGLPLHRRDWIKARGDVEEYDGRAVNLRDDGRAAVRRAGSAGTATATLTAPLVGTRRVLRAQPGRCVSQMHYARRG